MKCSLPVFAAFTLLGSASTSQAEIDFAKEVLPILSNKCFLCHGPDTKKAKDLRLDSFEGATADRDGVQAIVPGDPKASELVHRIFDQDDPMPPEDAEHHLTDPERELLRQWVTEGGEYALHWAFVKPSRSDAAAESIDHFVGEKIKAEGIDFANPAEPETLARRAALVLTGLPPKPSLLADFLGKGASSEAFGELVDALLSSPRYGEHQARYWLDAVRYGDTHGLHLDNRRGIYPYRDWVIMAFNENQPFDEFLTWQLAGDLLPDPSLEQLVATGFVRMNPSTAEGGAIPDEFQAKNNFDRVETLGTALLGLSLNCVRCHTHKYDPIQHEEYYELMAFFNSTQESPLDGNKYEYPPTLKAPADLAAWTRYRELREADDQAGLAELEQTFTTTLVARELAEPRVTHVLERGEYDMPIGDPVSPRTIRVAGPFPDDAPANRLGLAQWLTSPENPLTSRVLVNRIWQRVFGDGLVRTPEDLGRQGEQPTHPELLDWLAIEFQESGWDLQHLLRLMVTSRTFQQSSARSSAEFDPENRLLARGPSFRLDAEVIRDIGLVSSGLLDPTMGGEGVKPYQPAGLWSALMHPRSNTRLYETDSAPKAYRRSLYVYWKRTSPHPMMTLFDAPSRETSCVRRTRSNTALQSLGLLNENQRVEMAGALAADLVSSFSDPEKRLDELFTRLASRPPDEAERRACHTLLKRLGDRPEGDAWTQLVTTVLASDLAILLY